VRWNRPQDFTRIAARFDAHTTYLFGGRPMSLDDIVAFLRRRFVDARVHFVLVRGRRGGPPPSKKPFDPATLDAQLDEAARAFVASEKYVQWTPPYVLLARDEGRSEEHTSELQSLRHLVCR